MKNKLSKVFLFFTDQDMKEASDNRVEISDFDKETVENMVTFIYQGDLENECFTLELLGISEKYQINELKKR